MYSSVYAIFPGQRIQLLQWETVCMGFRRSGGNAEKHAGASTTHTKIVCRPMLQPRSVCAADTKPALRYATISVLLIWCRGFLLRLLVPRFFRGCIGRGCSTEPCIHSRKPRVLSLKPNQARRKYHTSRPCPTLLLGLVQLFLGSTSLALHLDVPYPDWVTASFFGDVWLDSARQ